MGLGAAGSTGRVVALTRRRYFIATGSWPWVDRTWAYRANRWTRFGGPLQDPPNACVRTQHGRGPGSGMRGGVWLGKREARWVGGWGDVLDRLGAVAQGATQDGDLFDKALQTQPVDGGLRGLAAAALRFAVHPQLGRLHMANPHPCPLLASVRMALLPVSATCSCARALSTLPAAMNASDAGASRPCRCRRSPRSVHSGENSSELANEQMIARPA